jgi:hypothetical protein
MTDKEGDTYTSSHRAGHETTSSSTVGDDNSSNTDVNPVRAEEKATPPINAATEANKDDSHTDVEALRTKEQHGDIDGDTADEIAKRISQEGEFPEGGFLAWAGVASTGLVMVSVD